MYEGLQGLHKIAVSRLIFVDGDNSLVITNKLNWSAPHFIQRNENFKRLLAILNGRGRPLEDDAKRNPDGKHKDIKELLHHSTLTVAV
jgi:hypothetical protein